MVTVAAAGPQRANASGAVISSGSSQPVTVIPQPRQVAETSIDPPVSVVISAAEQLFAATAVQPTLHWISTLLTVEQVAAQPVMVVSAFAQVSGSSVQVDAHSP